MKATILLTVAGFAMLGTLGARTWTSAEGGKTFDADVVSYDVEGKTVEVRLKTGKMMKFAEDKLSDADIKFLKEWDVEQNKPDPAEELAGQVVGGQLSKAKIHKLEGNKFKKVKLESAPEYYILYFSASW